MTDVFVRENRDSDTQGEGHVMMEAETGETHVQAKECHILLGTPEARKETWNRLSPRVFREHGPTKTLISDSYPPEL